MRDTVQWLQATHFPKNNTKAPNTMTNGVYNEKKRKFALGMANIILAHHSFDSYVISSIPCYFQYTSATCTVSPVSLH